MTSSKAGRGSGWLAYGKRMPCRTRVGRRRAGKAKGSCCFATSASARAEAEAVVGMEDAMVLVV